MVSRLDRSVSAMTGCRQQRHQDGGHEKGVGDPLVGHEPEELDGVHVPQDHRDPSARHPAERPARPADVEQGHRHQAHGVLVDLEGVPGGQLQHDLHVAVGEHHALGQSGRARRVELHRHVVGATLVPGVAAGVVGEPVLVADPTGEVRGASEVGVGLGISEDHHARHPRQPALHGRQARHELGVDDEDLGSGVVDHGRHLGGSEAPVDGHVDGAAQGTSEEDLEVLEPVAIEEGHPVAEPDALGPQRVRHATGAVVVLGPGHRGALEPEHRLVAVVDDVGPEHAGHARTPHRLPLVPAAGGAAGPAHCRSSPLRTVARCVVTGRGSV